MFKNSGKIFQFLEKQVSEESNVVRAMFWIDMMAVFNMIWKKKKCGRKESTESESVSLLVSRLATVRLSFSSLKIWLYMKFRIHKVKNKSLQKWN